MVVAYFIFYRLASCCLVISLPIADHVTKSFASFFSLDPCYSEFYSMLLLYQPPRKEFEFATGISHSLAYLTI